MSDSRTIKIAMSGIGGIKHHFHDLLRMPEKEFSDNIQSIAQVLSKTDSEILFTPSRGVCLEIAKRYKKFHGNKVTALLPVKDKIFGVKHFKDNLDIKIDGKKLFDKTIDTDSWYKQHFAFGLFGHILLVLGSSLGTFYELSSAFYVYKIISGNKQDVKVIKKKIHKDIVAGDEFPFTIIIYLPFMSKLSPELEHYIKESGGQLFYANNADDLKNILDKLSRIKAH